MQFWQKIQADFQAEQMYDTVVLGAGFAGAFTIEEICRQLPATSKIAIVDSYGLFNAESSSRNECFKMHTGLHYIGDRETAETCLRNSVQMADAFYDYILDPKNSTAPTRRGRHYLVSNSPFTVDYVMEECTYLKQVYAQLIKEFPNAQKVFGDPEKFITYLKPEQYDYVASSILFDKETGEKENIQVILGIETPECQIDLEKFRSYFDSIAVHRRGQLTSFYSHTVVQIHPPEDFIGYVVETKYFDPSEKKWLTKNILTKSVINCTWQNIDVIDSSLNYNDHNPCTIRAKVLVRASVPESLSKMNTCIFFSGPHVSVTRVPSHDHAGDDMIITYEPITNVGHYPAALPAYLIEDKNLKTLANYSPFHPGKEREILKSKLGQDIMLGASRYIPDLQLATIKEVGVGFVKMFSSPEKGNGYLYSSNSPIHQRREHGIQVRDLCYISFSGIKMTYTFTTAQTVVEILKQQLLIQKKLNDYLMSVINHPDFDQHMTYRLKSTVLRSLTAFLLSQMKKDGIYNDLESTVSEGMLESWILKKTEKTSFIIAQYMQQIDQHISMKAML